MEKIYTEKMKKCLKLAKKGSGKVEPNPMVGCVIVDENGNEVASSYHKKYGEFHAERNAILGAKDVDFKGATLFVNLEPCFHFGKTPPCVDLIIEKGIKKVVIAMVDPNPKVQGASIQKMKEAGIEVITGVLEDEAKELNKVFIKNIVHKKPYIALKTATTMDGKIATPAGSSKWITGENARNKVMQLRSEFCAIMSGSNTILADDSSLTARIKNGKNPIRIVMDRDGKIPYKQNIFANNCEKIYHITNTETNPPKHVCAIKFENFNGLLDTLYQNGIYSVLIESGCALGSILIKEQLVDEIFQFVAPKILGCGKNFIDGFCVDDINDCLKLRDIKTEFFDPDILINAKFVYDK